MFRRKLKRIDVLLDKYAIAPKRAHDWDAGLDIMTPRTVAVSDTMPVIVDTGVHVAIPEGYVGMIKSKSGLNTKYGITCEGVVDAGYTGPIKVKLYMDKHGCTHTFNRGDKIAQLVILPVETPEIRIVHQIKGGERGDAGFGSTGA